MTVVLAFGSETGDSSEVLTATGTLDFAYTAVKGSGNYGVRLNPTAATSLIRLRGVGTTGAPAEMGLTTAYGGAWVQFASIPTGSVSLVDFTNSANGIMARIIYRSSSGCFALQYTDGTDTTQTVVDTFTVVANTPYYIEVGIVNAGTAGAASIEGRINGTVYATASGLTLRSASRTLDRITVGSGASHTADYVIDDVYVDTAGFLGAVGVELLTPDSAGDSALWNEGTGNTFAEVDELPHDSDTSYIKESSSGQVSYFHCSPSSSRVTNRIFSLKGGAVLRDEGGVSLVRVRIREDAANAEVECSNSDPGATYVLRTFYAAVDPNTTAAWTKERVDDAQIAVVNAAAVAVRCTSMWLQVVYQPGKRLLPLLGVA